MLFLQFVLYSSSFVGTLKNEIPGAALELWQLKIEQFSPGILKFSTKHKGNPLTLNFLKVSRTFLFIFYAGSRGLGSKNFRNSSYREKTAGSARVSRLSSRFLWLWLQITFSKESIKVKKVSNFNLFDTCAMLTHISRNKKWIDIIIMHVHFSRNLKT